MNARYVKQVPGRKTDISVAQWLAILARGGTVPPANLRLIARGLQKLMGDLGQGYGDAAV